MQHAAALLGEVSHAANNFEQTVQRPDGTTAKTTKRDAQAAPNKKRRRLEEPCGQDRQRDETPASTPASGEAHGDRDEDKEAL